MGVLHKDEQSGVDTFVANAGIPLLGYGEGECIKAGFLYYYGQCFGIPATNVVDKVQEEPVLIAGKPMYYVYVRMKSEAWVGIV